MYLGTRASRELAWTMYFESLDTFSLLCKAPRIRYLGMCLSSRDKVFPKQTSVLRAPLFPVLLCEKPDLGPVSAVYKEKSLSCRSHSGNSNKATTPLPAQTPTSNLNSQDPLASPNVPSLPQFKIKYNIQSHIGHKTRTRFAAPLLWFSTKSRADHLWRCALSIWMYRRKQVLYLQTKMESFLSTVCPSAHTKHQMSHIKK